METIKPICEKYGPILNEYLKKNSNNQNRSFFLFTCDSLKDALRAKVELSKRKDLLGDKRVEVTLLLDESIITKGHDLSRTETLFQDEDRKEYPEYSSLRNSMMGYPVYQHMHPSIPYLPHYYEPYPPYHEPSYYQTFVENG